MSDTTAAPALVPELQEQLHTTARLYRAALAQLEPIAIRLADLEGRSCAASAPGRHLPPIRARRRVSCAADIAHGHLHALRPYVLVVANEAMRRAEDALAEPGQRPRARAGPKPLQWTW